ncbi:MAG TPA: transcription termination/antitermination NusG family protein [Blastocatellia bacterium]|nr:transcription termination/antitermination NusG family protein [Blastocatellia bacterium]
MSCAIVTDIPVWYAIHTHPKQENRADMNLKAWGVETFFPRIRDCRFNEYTSKPSFFVKPLFPGYIFARFALNALFHKVRFTRGVHSIVSIAGDPALVDARVIEIIVAQIDEAGFVKVGVDLEPGAKVLIQAGPFKGLTGVFERKTSDVDRIKILLDCVNFQARIEVERIHVKAF